MLEGMRDNTIIAGAYTDSAGICPMLAAHRAGGRTSAISFARAWDRFTFGTARVWNRFAFGGARARRPRRATARELRVLTAHLEASLLAEEDAGRDLTDAITSHRQLVAARRPSAERDGDGSRPAAHAGDLARPGDAHRAPQLAGVPGWSWTRLTRTLDEYERTLEQLQEHERALESLREQPAPQPQPA
jgi:hypothetical protein